jgi:hypothetical protein
MRSSEMDRREAAREPDKRSSPAWIWWGLFGGLAAIFVLCVLAMLHNGSAGVGRNRGPASEAAPGNQPSRDIDRSRAR